MQIVGLVGLIGSGKDSVAIALSKKGFKRELFANSLKDSVAAMYGWPRALLEGDTEESRNFRETVDPFWSSVFGYEVTPRLALQIFGTEVVRNNMHEDMWVYSLIKRIHSSGYDKFVITDVRFPNEIHMLKSMGAKIYKVKRGEYPDWYSKFVGKSYEERLQVQADLASTGLNIHASEWSHIGIDVDGVIENDSTLADLHSKVLREIGD